MSFYPGGYDGNGIQIGKQFAEITAIASYAFIMSYIILTILRYIPGMHLRVTEEAEMAGLDRDQFFDEQIGDWAIFEHLETQEASNCRTGGVVAEALQVEKTTVAPTKVETADSSSGSGSGNATPGVVEIE
jgi:hypothetical protein